MKYLLLLLTFGILQLSAATVTLFKDVASTNSVKANDLLLVDTALGGTNYLTRTATISNVVTKSSITNALAAPNDTNQVLLGNGGWGTVAGGSGATNYLSTTNTAAQTIASALTVGSGLSSDDYFTITAPVANQSGINFAKTGGSKWLNFVPGNSSDLYWYDGSSVVLILSPGSAGLTVNGNITGTVLKGTGVNGAIAITRRDTLADSYTIFSQTGDFQIYGSDIAAIPITMHRLTGLVDLFGLKLSHPTSFTEFSIQTASAQKNNNLFNWLDGASNTVGSISSLGKVEVGSANPAIATLQSDGPALLTRGVTISNVINVHAAYAIGDSLTAAGYYPLKLRSLLGSSWNVFNLGVDGDTTTQMIARTNSIVGAGDAEYAIVWGGINDVIADTAAGPIESNLQQLYNTFKTAGLGVISINLTPFKTSSAWTSGRQTVFDSVNTWIAGTATNVDYKIDAFSVLVDPGNSNTLLPAYDGGDHLHLSTAGYWAVATNINSNATFTGAAQPTVALNVNGAIKAGTSNAWTFGAVAEGGTTNITITINGKTYTLRAN